MNIENIVKNTIKNTENAGGGGKIDDLLQADFMTDDIKENIFEFWKNELDNYIDNYAKSSPDINANKGMYKCSLETWEACITDIGRNYFYKNRFLLDKKKIAAQGGTAYRDDLLLIGLELYEYYCKKYRKQFFIYDCCVFLHINKDTMYKLNNIHADLLKKAHTAQESSYRAALASGRSNVTATAILLNHDYNYTRTTEIIHTSDRIRSADTLPVLKIDDITNNESKRSSENM